MFLFPSRTILLQLQVIILQEQIFKRFSLGEKERRIKADSCQKYEDLIQNILCKDSCQKYEDLARKYDKVAHPLLPFCCVCFFNKSCRF